MPYKQIYVTRFIQDIAGMLDTCANLQVQPAASANSQPFGGLTQRLNAAMEAAP